MTSPSSGGRPLVIVMVKAPRAGHAKTRLTPPLTPDDAASLAATFAQDVMRAARLACPDVLVAYAPDDGRTALAPLAPADVLWATQQGDDLGERLDAALADADTRGFGPRIVIGTDSPTLPGSALPDAFSALQNGADIVLGPAEDGGYYLIGMHRRVPDLFDGVAWSTPDARAHTAANAARLGLRLHVLPPWYDVDTFADLVRLRQELTDDPKARRRAPATVRWLQSHPLPDLLPEGARPQTAA